MVILGIDPGLAHTGWGVVEQTGSVLRCLGYGCISTPASRSTAERLSEVHRELKSIIDRYQPRDASVESVYFGTNAKTAFATGQARGVAILATADAGLSLAEYGPGQIKLAVVGTGAADKQQVQYMVRAILGLPLPPQPDHAADALAAAICHAHTRAPASNRRDDSRAARRLDVAR